MIGTERFSGRNHPALHVCIESVIAGFDDNAVAFDDVRDLEDGISHLDS